MIRFCLGLCLALLGSPAWAMSTFSAENSGLYIGLVGSHVEYNFNANSSFQNSYTRIVQPAMTAPLGSQPRPIFTNVFSSTATYQAALEYPIGSGCTQYTFNGSSTGTAPVGASIIADIPPITVPNGAQYAIDFYYSTTTNVVISNSGLSAQGDGAIYGTTASPATNSVSTCGHPSVTTEVYTPTAIVGLTTQRSFLFLGDSRVFGTNDTVGFFEGEFAHGIGPNFSFVNYGISGQTAAGYVSANYYWMPVLAPFVTDVLSELGINDFRASSTAASVISSQQTLAAEFPNALYHVSTVGPNTTSSFSITTLTSSGTLCTATAPGAQYLSNGMSITISGATPTAYNGTFTISNVVIAGASSTFNYTALSAPGSSATGTLLGTDNWATLGNQTPVAGTTTQRTLYNDTIRTHPTWITGYVFENAGKWEAPTSSSNTFDSSLILVNGTAQAYSLDGLHPSPSTYTLISQDPQFQPYNFPR
jgi:hypothetical protein